MSERQLSGDFQIAILKVKMDSIERSRVRSDLKVIPIEMRKPWKTQGCEKKITRRQWKTQLWETLPLRRQRE